MDFRRYLAWTTMCMLILTGCNTGPSVDNEPTPTPITVPVPPGEKQLGTEPTLEPHNYTDNQGLPFPMPSTEANPIISVSREAAWGSNLDVQEIPASIDDDHILILKAVSEDGKTIVCLIIPRDVTSFESPKLILMDVRSRQITEITTRPEEYLGVSIAYGWADGTAMDGEWVVWPEGEAIQVYNIMTHARSQIKVWDGVLNTNVRLREIISVDHGVAVWAEQTSEEPEQDRVYSVLKSVELATGHTEVIGRHGVNPAISWPNVVWIEPDLTTLVEGQVLSRLVTLDLQTGKPAVLSGLHGVDEVAIQEDTTAWRGWSMGIGTVFLLNFAETRRQVIAPQDNTGTRENLTMNERLVAWDSPKGDVWDRVLGRLVRLNGIRGVATARLKGHTLAWQAMPNYSKQARNPTGNLLLEDMSIYVMDTSQLPK